MKKLGISREIEREDVKIKLGEEVSRLKIGRRDNSIGIRMLVKFIYTVKSVFVRFYFRATFFMRYMNFNGVGTTVMFSVGVDIHIHLKTLCSFVLNSLPIIYIQLFSLKALFFLN